MTKEIIFTEKAPSPIGPYSQAMKAKGELLFISGQIPFTPEGNIAGEDILSQTHQSIKNIIAILESAGTNIDNVVKCTVFLKDMNHFSQMNQVYSEYFNTSKPARAAVEVARLPKDVLVEIEAIALIP